MAPSRRFGDKSDQERPFSRRFASTFDAADVSGLQVGSDRAIVIAFRSATVSRSGV